jgi:hypothetical protein
MIVLWSSGPGSPATDGAGGDGGAGPLPPIKRSAQIRKQLDAVKAATAEKILPLFFKNPLYKPKAPADAKARAVQTDIKLLSSGTGRRGPATGGGRRTD